VPPKGDVVGKIEIGGGLFGQRLEHSICGCLVRCQWQPTVHLRSYLRRKRYLSNAWILIPVSVCIGQSGNPSGPSSSLARRHEVDRWTRFLDSR
jgi:hypothetical protein